MYHKRNDLEQLVKSLTTSEKRYLTNVFKQSPDNAMYVSLYYKVQKSESGTGYDDSGLTGRVKIEQKRFLYKTILKHLKQMYPDLSPDVSIQSLLADVELLYNHSLSEQAMLLLVKAKQIATLHEKFGLHLQILQWEQKLSIVLDRPYRPIELIRAEEEEILAKNAQINTLLGFYSEIMLLKKKHGYARGGIKDQLDAKTLYHPSFPSSAACKSKKASYYHNLISSLYHWMTFDHEQAFKFSKALLRDDDHDILPSDYINGLFQHITSSVCLARFKDALNGIQLVQSFMEEYKLNQSLTYRQFFFAYNATYRLIIYGYMGDEIKLMEVISDTERQLIALGDLIPVDLRQVVIGNIMNAYLVIDDLDNAWITWNKLFGSQSKAIRRDLYADLYLFRVFFLLHSKNFDLLASTTASALHFFRKEENRSQFPLESTIVQLFAKDIDYSSKKNLHPLLQQACKLLTDYISECSGKIGFQEHFTRYVIWAEAIEKEIPYYKAAQQWYTGFTRTF